MNNQQIIRYIKLREAWRDALWKESNTLSSIWNGLFRFGFLLIHYLADRQKFLKEIVQFPKRSANLPLYFLLVWGLWGLFDSVQGVFEYFPAKEEAERIKKRVEELERLL